MVPRDAAMLQCYQVPGQTWPTELGWLFDTFQTSKRHVEIGTYCGRSLLATCLGMRHGEKHVVSVDSNCDSPIGRDWVSAVRAATFNQIRRSAGINVQYIEMLSIDAARLCMASGLKFDSVFIDGDHNYAECKADIEVWRTLMNPGGILAGHDYWPNHVGVMDAVNEVLHGRFEVVPGTRIWVTHV